MTNNHRPYLMEAVATARAAGGLLMRRRGTRFQVGSKGRYRSNLVTEIDLASEKLIVTRLRRAFVGHGILAEENRYEDDGADYRWIIDPLDGTTNYAHGYPCFSISIALQQAGRTIVGVVYNPNLDEMFTTVAGQGAFLNGRRIEVSSVQRLKLSLLSTGFPPHIGRDLHGHVRHFEKFLSAARALRRDGSAAIDLCYVACGRFDGYYELKLNPWDVAAGELMIREAGGNVTHYDGTPFRIFSKNIVASNGRIHGALLRVLNS